MFNNLVTYHVHKRDPLPPSDALAYQYILAGNGLFVRAETCFFEAIVPIVACTVRGLAPLRHHFRLKVPRIPARLLDIILADARRARRPDGGLNEIFYQFHHHGRTVQVQKPPQQTSCASVMAAGVEFRQNTKTVEFRELVETNGGKIIRLPEGSFKEMGTGVNTVIVTMLRL